MKFPIYHINAFTDALFMGNPATVCPLHHWLSDRLMQTIAAENNLPATAFFVPNNDYFELRWFTPTMELELCGHGTLAAAFVIFNYQYTDSDTIEFKTKKGNLTVLNVEEDNRYLAMKLPISPHVSCSSTSELLRGLRQRPKEVWLTKNNNYLAVYESEQQIANLYPDMRMLTAVNGLGVIITAPGENSDFVSRYFAPNIGIPEDAVTGSTHCSLVPYWTDRLNKKLLHARQLSARGGELYGEVDGEQVILYAQANCYSQGELLLDQRNGTKPL